MTTKEQERAALAKIEKILATVDPDGWLAEAFRGCLDDARQNIENDFVCSYYDRWQHADAKRGEALEELDRTRAELDATRAELEKARAGVLDRGTVAELRQLVLKDENRERRTITAAAETMVEFSDAPQDIAFQDALQACAKARKEAARLEKLAGVLSGLLNN